MRTHTHIPHACKHHTHTRQHTHTHTHTQLTHTPTDNVAVASVFEVRGMKRQIMVANAHLHWNPMYKDVKVMQAAMLIEEIKSTFACLCLPPSLSLCL